VNDHRTKERSSDRDIVETVGQYKSRWYDTAGSLFRSRNTQRARAERQARQAEELRPNKEWLHSDLRESEERLRQTQQLLLQQQPGNEQLRLEIKAGHPPSLGTNENVLPTIELPPW